MSRRLWSALAGIALLTLVYFAAGRLGLSLALVHPSASAVWPPTGIALAALLVAGPRLWPGIFLGAFLVNLTTSGSVPASLGIAAGNTLEGVLGAYLVNSFAQGCRAFERVNDTFRFAVLAGLVGTMVSATLGVTSLVLAGLAAWHDYAAIWLTWWLGDAGGALIVAPVLILWITNPVVRWDRERAAEALILIASLILIAFIVFGGWSAAAVRNYPLEFSVVPIVVWAAYRFGQREAATVTLLLSAIAIWGTVQGLGPFGLASPNESLLLLQTFSGVIAVTGLVFAALTSEREQADIATRTTNERLRAGLHQLEQRNSDLALSSEMNHLLQGCLTADEAHAVLRQFGPRLFRMAAGGVYLKGTSGDLLEACTVWGAPPPVRHAFRPDDCWALRRGGAHYVPAGDANALVCPHIPPPRPSATLCIPMAAQGDTLGVLHLQSPPAAAAEALDEFVRQFAQTVGNGIALALSNLRLRESLRQQSIRDPLTDLFNRRFLEESLERELRRAERNKSTVGVIMLDLDRFKSINDRHGHPAGDAVLREFGHFLKASIRGGDIACRYGGEEFVLLLPDADLASARKRAEEIWKRARELRVPYKDGALGPITPSLGVAAYPQHGSVADALLRSVDAALYAAKRNGRDCVAVAPAAA